MVQLSRADTDLGKPHNASTSCMSIHMKRSSHQVKTAHYSPPMFTELQPYLPQLWSSWTPGRLWTQGLCIGCFLCQPCSSLRFYPANSLTSFMFLLNYPSRLSLLVCSSKTATLSHRHISYPCDPLLFFL